MSHLRTSLGAAIVLAGASAASATTIELIDDARLVDRAALVVVGTAEAKSSPLLERPATDWTIAVDRVLEGFVGEGRLVLRLPGGRAANGLHRHIFGTPPVAPGRRAILFLVPKRDGTFALADFPQGAFLEAAAGRRSFAFRDLSEVKVVGGAGRSGVRQPLRDFDRFADWIEDRAAGIERTRDYLVRPSRAELQAAGQAFTFITHDGNRMRWFDFDSGGTVSWRTHTTPMPGLSGGGTSEFQRGLAVWTNESTTPVKLAHVGSSSATGGLSNFDDQNVILWTDPNQEIEGTFNCDGGTLAIGGPWFDPDFKGTFDGKSYIRIQGADIVFNDGVECRKNSSPNYSEFIEEVAGHEAGHTLGLGHSSEKPNETNSTLKNALMYFRAKDNGKGAVLNSDDIGGLQTLYRKGGATGGGGGGGTPPPTGGCPAGTPANTLCLLSGRFRVTGTWTNQFDSSSGTAIPIPQSDLSGFFYFTDPQNVELILKILDFGTQIKVFYSQLTNLQFNLAVTDTASGRTKNYSNTPGDCGAIDDNFALAATASVAESEALAAAPLAATGSCVVSATTLCLLDRRFAVTVDWRNQFNGASGVGAQRTLSNLTGAFSFDDPANLEILIKTLDFGDRVLVLYGSLSNFEYTLRVTDTTSGRIKEYRNPAGTFCGGLDNNAF
jgi:hypothetical protein